MGKRAVNLSLDASLVDQARALDINLSQTLEQKLREVVRAAAWDRWRAENAEATASYNEHIERNGIFGEEWRNW